ncbi:unnamed protein product [Phytophthora fragariaefolia]|uniref:Unnamed protein product n=1 Tax=Phytophthora fragariaefolia TaxID=1490495 RepID=A0A9W7CUB8_9STRA|nr:unnamed protein product [Phytophthora fragariaefolia]
MQVEQGRARTGSDNGVESTAVAREMGDGNPGDAEAPATEDNASAPAPESDESSELLRLLHGVARRLDKQSHAKLEQRQEPPKKDPKSLVNTSLFASALGRGSRMHIDSLSGTPHTQMPRRPTAPPHFFGLRHADVGVHEPANCMSELERLYVAEHAAQAGQGAQQSSAAPGPPPQPDPHPQYVVERMLDAFRTNITPAQAMKLFTASKDIKRSWPEPYMYLVAVSEATGGSADYLVLNNIVRYASAELRTVLMAKVDQSRTDYLQHAEELAPFAQSWETESTKQKSLGRETVNAVRKAATSARKRAAVTSAAVKSLLEDVEKCSDEGAQPNGESLKITKRGKVLLRVTACGKAQMVELTKVFFAKGVVHNLISNGLLDKRGFELTQQAGRRVVAAKDGGRVTFDVEMRHNVLVVRAAVGPRHELPSDVIMAVLSKEAAESAEVSGDVQKGTVLEFHKRLAHLSYDSVRRLAKEPSSGIHLTDTSA